MRKLTGVRPIEVLNKNEGPTYIYFFNSSGVNLWLDNLESYASPSDGVPIPPNASFGPYLINGSIWIGADVDNTEFRYYKSKVPALAASQLGGTF